MRRIHSLREVAFVVRVDAQGGCLLEEVEGAFHTAESRLRIVLDWEVVV